MNILAVETATNACSVALLRGEEIFSRHCVAPQQHTELVVEFLDDILHRSACTRENIDAVALGCGPGSFTGVRIAASLAQGIASAHGLPVVRVSSLAALAWGARRRYGHQRVLTAIDARREELYVAAYHGTDNAQSSAVDDCLLAPEALEMPPGGPWYLAGDAWRVYAARLPAAFAQLSTIEHDYPDAQDTAQLGHLALLAGEAVDAADAVPRYWRAAVD